MLVLLHQVLSQDSVVSLAVIFVGSATYGYNDVAFHNEGYFWGSAYGYNDVAFHNEGYFWGSAYFIALFFTNMWFKHRQISNYRHYHLNLVMLPFNVALMLYEESFEYPSCCIPPLCSLPHLHRDWARPCHIYTSTGLTVSTSASGLCQPPATSAPGPAKPLAQFARVPRNHAVEQSGTSRQCPCPQLSTQSTLLPMPWSRCIQYPTTGREWPR